MSGWRWKACGVVLAPGLGACATALSSFQPAHVPERGHVQTELGLDLSYPTASVDKTVNAAETLDEAARERRLTQDEVFVILEGGANMAVDPPTVIPHAGVAYAPFERWEVGVRFAATGARLGVRRQLLAQPEHGIDLSVGLGASRSIFAPPIHTVLDTVQIDAFSRWNLDLPVTFGQHGSWYRWWFGPRFLYSHVAVDMTVTIPAENVRVAGTASGDMFYVGAHAGTVFGYRSVFVGPELTVVQLFGRAEVQAFDSTVQADLDSLIVYPAFAVLGEF